VKLVDPNGEFPFLVITAGAGALIGGVAGAIISYQTTGEVSLNAVVAGAAGGAAIGLGIGSVAVFGAGVSATASTSAVIGGLTATTAAGAGVAGAALKSIGQRAWESMSGLRFMGVDPQGLNRVQHVLRHATNDLSRKVHTVFFGGPRAVIGVLDETWSKAQTLGIQGVVQGANEKFVVPTGRAVGYLGGQSGAAQSNPALQNVVIIVRKGTSNVVTAFLE
jgi:hypothetical protein